MISVRNLNHSFKIGKKGKEKRVPVLKGLTFDVPEGEIVSIIGKSGSGKSTLLHIMAGFLTPESGEISVQGIQTSSFNEVESAKFRLDHFGFVFQNFQLMPGLTAFENVELPLTLKGISKSERQKKVKDLMQSVGLTDVQDHYPNELSGGQQQRVSIARALITDPPIIFADEPTGSLDSETEQDVLLLIQSLNKTRGITFVIITHDDEVAQTADRVYRMHDGILTEGGVQHAI
ncbi:ABC transporter ATP-binding protein [Sporosarcina sp. E16_8]|uniref:ABC transporter ATP-binding protein n=1 Tax=Sporosarcina sp. E16_8 TaxID=2789295 RepID=UPI001A91D47E|nr:ABC transporter ATP-binding protein [Sporosarcina sp. E16_8]MBO0589031.1 ABC transporter ATP-binding protein [Sporosarcina sp. E16_8]